MINVSSAYQNAIASYGREFKTRVTIGTTVIDSSKIKSIEIEDTFNGSDNELLIGSAISKKLKLSIFNAGAISYATSPIKIESGLVLPNNTVEYVTMGTYYPAKTESKDDWQTIDIEAYDFISKLNKPYVPTVSLPTTDTAIINDICTQNGIKFIGSGLGCVINKIYDYTEREQLGYMAGLQGRNAYITRNNKLDFKWYLMPKKYSEIETLKWSDAEKMSWAELSRRENR
ncbi:MAG: hypothetical protein RSF40_02195 [Oscillospiraceae bacterium]